MPEHITLRNSLTLALLGEVKTDSLLPAQQPSSREVLNSTDTYYQRLIKFPFQAIFHSYAEYIHALLLEASAEVVSFVPQPFLLWVNGRRYTPDCYVVRNSGVVVIEIKPKGIMVRPSPEVIKQFFKMENMSFEVLDDAVILERETEALNWLRLLQVMVVASRCQLDTSHEEKALLLACLERGPIALGDLISPLRREQQYQHEVALYRLLHRHQLETDLANHSLDYDSEIRLCS